MTVIEKYEKILNSQCAPCLPQNMVTTIHYDELKELINIIKDYQGQLENIKDKLTEIEFCVVEEDYRSKCFDICPVCQTENKHKDDCWLGNFLKEE